MNSQVTLFVYIGGGGGLIGCRWMCTVVYLEPSLWPWLNMWKRYPTMTKICENDALWSKWLRNYCIEAVCVCVCLYVRDDFIVKQYYSVYKNIKTFDRMTYFWCYEEPFDVITHFVTPWGIFDETTNFLTLWWTFDVMTYFWLNDELLDVMTYIIL